jgi:hypothetical protein
VSRARVLAAALALGASGCVTETTRRPEAVEIVAGSVEGRWKAVDSAGETLGYVARTRYSFARGEAVRFLVENAFFQEVGFLDENGRVFRHVPFREEPELVTTTSLAEGVRHLLRAPPGLALRELESAETPPGARDAAARVPVRPG